MLSHPYEYGNPEEIPVADLGGVPSPDQLAAGMMVGG
jgi:hypothetical protein